MSGGDDADLFIGGNAGDVVSGGDGGDDNDTLDLSGEGPLRVLTRTDDADGNSTSGTIGFLGADGSVTGTLAFNEIETLILPDGAGGNALGDPIAVDDTASTDEDTAVIIEVLGNDSDPEGDPITLVSAESSEGDVIINADGTLTFTPAENSNGDATISYTIEDDNGGSDTAQVIVTVAPINDDPVAVDDADLTDFETPVTIPVLGNDTDVDGDTLSVAETSSDDGLVAINGDGTITFTPADGFSGDAAISYTVSDGNGGTDTAVVTVTVGEDPRDGFVDGTDDGELIDIAYTGDPQGDMVDAGDALLPGAGPDDDFIRAGGGDDTVFAGEGDDVVLGQLGDDELFGEVGDDTIIGGSGNDTVVGGEGDDFINSGSGAVLPDRGYPGLFPPDPDPENDRDSVDGGDGDDTIITGDDRDTITGGDGDDVINAGIDDDIVQGDDGDDLIIGGEGNDDILGGEGDDTIYAGNAPGVLDILNIEDDGTNPFFGPDLRPDNGRDTVEGGAGDDVIFGADDDDLLFGGAGDDLLDGEIDNDTLRGGIGDDTLIGGQGDDSLIGGQGDDSQDGGIGDDTLRGNRGDDTLNGGDGDDRLLGGSGNDSFMGGDGDDTMLGGADRDEFTGVNAGDVVNGNEAGDDFDCLDLTGSAPEGGRLEIEYDPLNGENGTVFYFDEDDNPAGELEFTNIEKVVPCFTPGTRIATPKGERSVEDLQLGDRVITRDNGIQEIRWVGAQEFSGEDFARAEHLRPVLIRQGALGNDLPERDMMVSPNHRVLVANDKTALYFEEREVLVAAKHLTGLEGVDVVDASGTTYIHIMFEQHEVILSDGTWTESFQPGDNSLAGVGNAQRQEILEIFPELATRTGIDGYTSARRSLKKHEARLITTK
ncbi:type I secretion protein [Sulfitobacter sp. SK012]|nr:type I secretion protein [Sulfitobacter sp. SK012]